MDRNSRIRNHRLFRKPMPQLRDALEDDFRQRPERPRVEMATLGSSIMAARACA